MGAQLKLETSPGQLMTERLALKLTTLVDGMVNKPALNSHSIKLHEAYKVFEGAGDSAEIDRFSLQFEGRGAIIGLTGNPSTAAMEAGGDDSDHKI